MAEPTAALPPVSMPDVGITSAAIHMALGLLLVLAVILVGYWLLRRLGPRLGLGPMGKGGTLRLVNQMGLGPRKQLLVVRFLNKDLLLGVTEHSITLLTEVPTSHEADTDFADSLARAAATEDPPAR